MKKLSVIDCKKLPDHFRGGILQCLCDDELRILYRNRGFTEMLGYAEENHPDASPIGFAAMIYPDDRERVGREMDEQLARGASFAMTYRVVCADGTVKWVVENGEKLTRDGLSYTLRFLQDITVVQATREELQLSLERHKIIMNQTTDIIWEWNLSDDTLHVSANWQKKFGYPIFAERATERLAESRHLYVSDRDRLAEFLRGIRAGTPFSETEFRISDVNGRYAWFRIRATVIFDKNNAPFRAVGVISDIDQEKRRLEEYRKRAVTDALTGLLNRYEFQNRITAALSARTESALLIIDIDNFKAVNDTKGHLYGDAVLSGASTGMKRLIGKEG